MKKKCNAKTEVYSRVVGFFRPVDQWNDGKKEEYRDRKTYKIEKKKGEKMKNVRLIIFVLAGFFLLNEYYLIGETVKGSVSGDFSEIKGEIVKMVGGIVIVLLGWLFALIRGFVLAKIEEAEHKIGLLRTEIGKKIIGKVKKAIPEVMSELYLESRTAIKKIVEDGQISNEEVEEAVYQIRDRLLMKLKENDLEVLDEVFADGKEWVETKIKELLAGYVKKK